MANTYPLFEKLGPELEANTCYRRQAWEPACRQVAIGLVFQLVNWLRRFSDFFFQPTREDIKAIPKQTQITIDNQLKTALLYLEMDFGVNGALVPLFVHSSLLCLFQKEYFG